MTTRAALASSVRVKSRARAALFLLCVALDVLVLRRFLVHEEIAPGALRRGYFEEVEGRVTLVTTLAAGDGIFPEIGHDRAGDVSVPPGNTAVIPLAPGGAYRVSSQSSLAPYVVLGAIARSDRPSDRTPRPLLDARRLTARDGRLELTAWDPARPFRDDAAWLLDLRAACVEGAASLAARWNGGAIEVEIGRCAGRFEAPADATPVIAVVAGPDWDTVRREGARFPIVRQIRQGALLAAIALAALAAALLAGGIGPPAALSVSLITAIASAWVPGPAVICLALQLPLGAASAAWRVIARRLPRARVAARIGAWAAVMIAIAAPIALFARRREAPATAPAETTARCALTGYSAAAGSGLRRGEGAAGAVLGERCGACAGSAVTRAKPGATFRFVRDLACETPALLPRGGAVAFLGGSNDDILFWLHDGGPLSSVLYRAFTFADDTYHREPSLDAFLRLTEHAADASLRAIAIQSRLVGEAARCSRDAGDQLVFAHDFLVIDLARERSPARREMLARRRAAVEGAGGTFLDLERIFAGRAGVAWFNDFIHPSAIGHREIAAAICEQLGRPPP